MPVIDADDNSGDPSVLSHDSLKDDLIVCSVICFAIASLFVGLRFYTRTRIVKVLAVSDWFLLASLFGSGLQSAFFIREAVYGLGSHIWDFDVEANFRDLQQSAWFAILWYNASLPLIKVSLLLLYIKIFTYQRAELACKAILGLAILSGTYGVVLSLTNCIPLQASWDQSIKNAYCHSDDIWWANTALHVVTDFLIWSVPLPQLWRMTIPKPQKVTLISLFSLGFLVALISIIRIIYLDDLHETADPDFAWTGARFGFLSLIELNAAITVASLITLKPLAHRLLPNLMKANSLEELPGDIPPTIGTQPTPNSADRPLHRDRATTDTELEAWEMVRMDSKIHTNASSRN